MRNILYEDRGRRDVCENGERGRERRRGGRKGGSVSVLISIKRRLNVERNAPCPNLYNCSWIDDENYKKLGLLSCTLVVHSVKT